MLFLPTLEIVFWRASLSGKVLLGFGLPLSAAILPKLKLKHGAVESSNPSIFEKNFNQLQKILRENETLFVMGYFFFFNHFAQHLEIVTFYQESGWNLHLC